MKFLTIIFIILIGSFNEVRAQKLTFAYDSAGNQIERQRMLSISSFSTIANHKDISNNKKVRRPSITITPIYFLDRKIRIHNKVALYRKKGVSHE